jgi:hypothetical protein
MSRFLTRRAFVRNFSLGTLGLAMSTTRPEGRAAAMNIVEFEEKLAAMRFEHYRHPKVDVIRKGFRPVGGRVADFCTVKYKGQHHFFYIERRLQEATPFYPGHEIYFGHASTADFINWTVHDPVMLVRPHTWEEAHVWAPHIWRRGDEFIMAYTGLNRHLSQQIGLASSRDLFSWRRWPGNPIRLCQDKPWAFWREDGISSCRDPGMFEYDGRIWMTYTANTKTPASCIALASTRDFQKWEDHGPILVGPPQGYQPKLRGGHPQGSLESSQMVRRKGRWFLLLGAAIRDESTRNWVFESDDLFRFDFSSRRPFWPGAYTTEIVKSRDDRSLLACAWAIRFGEVNWADKRPMGRFFNRLEELVAWRD